MMAGHCETLVRTTQETVRNVEGMNVCFHWGIYDGTQKTFIALDTSERDANTMSESIRRSNIQVLFIQPGQNYRTLVYEGETPVPVTRIHGVDDGYTHTTRIKKK